MRRRREVEERRGRRDGGAAGQRRGTGWRLRPARRPRGGGLAAARALRSPHPEVISATASEEDTSSPMEDSPVDSSPHRLVCPGQDCQERQSGLSTSRSGRCCGMGAMVKRYARTVWYARAISASSTSCSSSSENSAAWPAPPGQGVTSIVKVCDINRHTHRAVAAWMVLFLVALLCCRVVVLLCLLVFVCCLFVVCLCCFVV